jgi:hypothetical protein
VRGVLYGRWKKKWPVTSGKWLESVPLAVILSGVARGVAFPAVFAGARRNRRTSLRLRRGELHIEERFFRSPGLDDLPSASRRGLGSPVIPSTREPFRARPGASRKRKGAGHSARNDDAKQNARRVLWWRFGGPALSENVTDFLGSVADVARWWLIWKALDAAWAALGAWVTSSGCRSRTCGRNRHCEATRSGGRLRRRWRQRCRCGARRRAGVRGGRYSRRRPWMSTR